MNYEPVVVGTQSNGFADPKSSHHDESKPLSDDGNKVDENPRKENECNDQEKEDTVNSTNNVNTVSSTVNVAGTNKDNELPFDPNMLALEDVSIFNCSSDDEDDVAVADMNNLDTTIQIKEEVYICKPSGFKDPDFPDRVYKVKKALYRLHQALRAWYETLSTYLLQNGFQRGKIDKTLFIKRYKGDILLKKDGIFISQDKYVAEMLKKFRFTEVKTSSTPMETQKPLLKDKDGKEIDVHMYRLMIGSLMYLVSSRPDIMFVVCAYARYQVNLKVSHLYVVKRIFRLISWQCKKQTVVANSTTEAEYVAASSCCRQALWIQNQLFDYGEVQIHARVDGKEIVITVSSVRRDLQLADLEGIDCLPNSTIFEQLALMGKPKRKDTQVPQPSGPTDNVADEAVYKELGDRLARAVTTASSLDAEQDSVDGPTCQETIRDTTAQTRVLDLEKTKTTQKNEIDSLKRRVKKLEKRNRSRTHKLKRLYKVGLSARVESSGDEESLGEDASKQGMRIDAINADEDITLVNDADNEMFDVDDLGGDEVFVEEKNDNVVEEVVNAAQVSTAATTKIITNEEITLAQALEALKTLKPKVKGIVFHEPGKYTTTTTFSLKQSQDKGKGIMIEEPDDIQAKIDADHQLAERMQAQEQEELFDAKKATLFQQLLEKRRKHFAAKRAKEKRNKPPTKAQQRKIMCTYLKNMEGFKLKDLKLKEFDSIKEMFNRAFRK
nr:hypothetical protein [Tanacetum cinerariifolium]